MTCLKLCLSIECAALLFFSTSCILFSVILSSLNWVSSNKYLHLSKRLDYGNSISTYNDLLSLSLYSEQYLDPGFLHAFFALLSQSIVALCLWLIFKAPRFITRYDMYIVWIRIRFMSKQCWTLGFFWFFVNVFC